MPTDPAHPVAEAILRASSQLSAALAPLTFAPPVTHVYNPLEYAWNGYRAYVERYASDSPDIVFTGMNPGPWGMAQTGVPFGDVTMVRDWLGIEAAIGHPEPEHPKRPIEGFACRRHEVSGTRFWGWARDHFGTAERFFARCYVANYCPLTFMEESGRNRTPDRLRRDEREAIYTRCNATLRETVTAIGASTVIAIGGFAEDRATEALEGTGIRVVRVLHPSPANPAANRGWGDLVEQQLTDLGIHLDA